MTSLRQVRELETIDHLDDPEVRCTTRFLRAVAVDCDRPARWYRCCGHCGHDGFSCGRCRQWALESGTCRGCKPILVWVVEAWVWRPL